MIRSMMALQDVVTGRDGWDWLLLIVSLVAGAIAIVVFPPWALERRRRPEVDILFQVSETGEPEQMRDWKPDEVVDLRPGQQLLVMAAMCNVGDRSGDATLVNLVVPGLLNLRLARDEEAEPIVAPNMSKYFARSPNPWTPGNWFVMHVKLTVSAGTVPPAPLRGRILFTISDERFNRTGRRWLPSVLPPAEPATVVAGEPWPPRSPASHRWWRSIRWVTAKPHGRIYTTRGNRDDVRDIRVLPQP